MSYPHASSSPLHVATGLRGTGRAGSTRTASSLSLRVEPLDPVGIASSYTRVMAKAAKVMISLPPDLLERLDRVVRERGTSRSAFLQGVVRRELGWPDPVAFDAAVDRGRRALAAAGAFESAELIREERDARDERDRHR